MLLYLQDTNRENTMSNELIALFQLFLFAYILSIGFGMVTGGPRGVRTVHRFWLKLLFGTIKWGSRTIGDLFHWMGRKPKKKP